MTSALVILGLLLLNALFVAAEFAIIGASRPRIERAAASGSRAARQVQKILRDPRQQDQYIATAQLGITFSSLALGMYGEHQLAHGLMRSLDALGLPAVLGSHAIASVLAIVCLTYLHVVLGEIVPKTVALQHAVPTALRISAAMHFIQRVLWPLVRVLEGAGNQVLRALRVQRGHTMKALSAQSLRSMVEDSVGQGGLEQDAGGVLDELFAFGDLSASEVMTARVRVVGLPAGASLAEMRRVVQSAPHSRYPVYEGTLDQIVGLVLVRDVLAHLLDATPLSAAAVRPVPFIPATARLDVVLARMRRERTQMVVVMDEQGGTAGIITTEDLFEEVVGQVSDGQAPRATVYAEGGELCALGMARIAEVAKHLGLERSNPEVETVSGLVLSILNRPPRVGDQVTWQGIELRVQSVEGHGVRALAVRVATASGDHMESAPRVDDDAPKT